MLEGFCVFKFPGDAEVVGLGNRVFTQDPFLIFAILTPLQFCWGCFMQETELSSVT